MHNRILNHLKHAFLSIAKCFMPKMDETEPDRSPLEEFKDKSQLFRLNRLLSDRRIVLGVMIAIPFVLLLVGNYIYNITSSAIQSLFASIRLESVPVNYGFDNFFRFPPFGGYYVLIFFLSVLLEFVVPYRIRTAYKDFNVSQKGAERWATMEELRNQYIAVPEKDLEFEGKGGVPVAWDRERNEILIDTTAINNYIIGTTRSGKGEGYMFSTIDIYSRAKIKPSLIIGDPKLEIYKMASKTLRKRGFKIFLLNLSDPSKTNCFNPIQSAIDSWKKHDYATAELLVQSLCYSIFNSDGAGAEDDRFWNDTSTNVLAALVLAHIADCLEQDETLNAMEYSKFQLRKSLYKQLTPAQQEAVRNGHSDMDFESILAERTTPIENSIQWTPIIRHEKEITMYSIMVTFTSLTSISSGNDRTALDVYFEKRLPNDKARLKYLSASVAGDKTKGSIFSTMATKLTVFTYENIAKMTSTSDINLLDVGFGEEPYAIFLSLPDYDSSNHFISSIFIRQLYFVLSKHCTDNTNTGQCTREVVFLLDEFGNIPAIENMSNIITVALGRNIRFNLLVQSNAQIENLYGKNTETIIGNCGNKYFLSSGDLSTREHFSKELGNKTVVNVNRSGQKLSLHKSFTEMYEEKPLMNPNELMHLHEGELIVSRIMTRHDLKGNDIISAPIFARGNSRFRYRNQYLTDTFPNLSDIDLSEIHWPSTKHLKLYQYDIDAHFDRLSDQKKLEEQKQNMKI